MVSRKVVLLVSHMIPSRFGAHKCCSGTRVSSYLPLSNIDGISCLLRSPTGVRCGVELSPLLSDGSLNILNVNAKSYTRRKNIISTKTE